MVHLPCASQYFHEELRRVKCISQSQSSINFNKESKDMVKGMLCWSKIWTPLTGGLILRALIPMGVPQWGFQDYIISPGGSSQEPSRHITKKPSLQLTVYTSLVLLFSYINTQTPPLKQGEKVLCFPIHYLPIFCQGNKLTESKH